MSVKAKLILLGVLYTTLSTSLFAQDSTWNAFGGYIRSGFGMDGQGKALDVFKAPNSETKYRLGNEAETYMEAVGKYGLKDENGAVFETDMRLAIVTPTSNSNSFATTISLREAFVKASGILKKQKSVAFWAGQRFYNRIEVYMIDYFPRDMSGFGGGIEDIPIGRNAKLAFAYLGGSIDQLNPDGTVRPVNQFSLNKTTLDIQVYDINLGFGTLGIAFDASLFDGDVLTFPDEEYEISSDLGWSAGLYHEKSFEGGRNYFQLFYGTGAAENGMAIISQPMGVVPSPGEIIEIGGFKRFRAIEDVKIDFSPHFSMLGLLLYQRLNNNMPSNNILNWYSAGVRPVFYFNRYFSAVGEFGWDYTSQEGLDSGSLFKITIAPQITPLNKILTRPAIRAFFTYARWSDDFLGQVAPTSFPLQNNGLSFGIQMEVWW